VTRLAVLLALLVSLGGCDIGDQGAVSVRWRIVEKQSGKIHDPGSLPSADGTGACQCTLDNPDCSPVCQWKVQSVKLLVRDPVTLDPAPVDDVDVTFPCRVREATTRFAIPAGRWAVSLSASGDATTNPTTPAPDVREVKHGQINNLDVIEISVCPLPRN
jgi:hypothetical protein